MDDYDDYGGSDAFSPVPVTVSAHVDGPIAAPRPNAAPVHDWDPTC
jgi:hypothetical protein